MKTYTEIFLELASKDAMCTTYIDPTARAAAIIFARQIAKDALERAADKVFWLEYPGLDIEADVVRNTEIIMP